MTVPQATDVGRFNEWIATAGTEAGLTVGEVKELLDGFLDAYRAASTTGSGKEFDKALKFYQVNLDTIVLRGEMVDRGGKFISSFSATGSVASRRFSAYSV